MFNKGDSIVLSVEHTFFTATFYGFFDRYLDEGAEYGDCVINLDGGLCDELVTFESRLRPHMGREELPTLEKVLDEIKLLASHYDDGKHERMIEVEVQRLIETRELLKLLESAETERDMWKQKYEDLRKDISL